MGFGLLPGESLRSCVLAAGLARSLHLPEDDARAAYYTALLNHVGCTSYAHETARAAPTRLTRGTCSRPSSPRCYAADRRWSRPGWL
jgi:hypothetical protein